MCLHISLCLFVFFFVLTTIGCITWVILDQNTLSISCVIVSVTALSITIFVCLLYDTSNVWKKQEIMKKIEELDFENQNEKKN